MILLLEMIDYNAEMTDYTAEMIDYTAEMIDYTALITDYDQKSDWIRQNDSMYYYQWKPCFYLFNRL